MSLLVSKQWSLNTIFHWKEQVLLEEMTDFKLQQKMYQMSLEIFVIPQKKKKATKNYKGHVQKNGSAKLIRLQMAKMEQLSIREDNYHNKLKHFQDIFNLRLYNDTKKQNKTQWLPLSYSFFWKIINHPLAFHRQIRLQDTKWLKRTSLSYGSSPGNKGRRKMK